MISHNFLRISLRKSFWQEIMAAQKNSVLESLQVISKKNLFPYSNNNEKKKMKKNIYTYKYYLYPSTLRSRQLIENKLNRL